MYVGKRSLHSIHNHEIQIEPQKIHTNQPIVNSLRRSEVSPSI